MRKVLVELLCTVALGAFANPADDLLNRIDKGAAAKFKTVLVKSDKDFFEIDQAQKETAHQPHRNQLHQNRAPARTTQLSSGETPG